MKRSLIDVNGKVMKDVIDEGEAIFTIERDDGFLSENKGSWFMSPYDEWPECQRIPLRKVKGRVLDIGCGMGRISLYLQSQGYEVVGIDISPLAIQICREMGLKDARVMSADSLDFPEGFFDTVILYGNNWGIMGEPELVVKMLKDIHRITTKDAILLAETIDPGFLKNPEHVKYHEANIENGRPLGQWRIRLKYKDMISDWDKILFSSLKDMKMLAKKGSWTLVEVVGDESLYVGILEKE